MKALWRCFASTSKKCQPRTDDAVTEAITEAAEPSDARLSDDDGGTRLAITLMTRKPHRFDWWLRYHKSLGVCHFFIHVEDTPELLELLDSDEFRGFVTVTSGEDASPDNYYTLQQRQEAQVRRSLKLCRVQRIPWLLHIDDDEILHLDVPFSAIAHHAPEGVSSLVFINLEAVPHRLGSHCAFEDITTFTLHKMLAYRNGKAAGRTSLARWQGPHRFSGESHIVSVEDACVLHFESCTYEVWRNKFLKHRHTDELATRDIPFAFYRDSISLFQSDPTGGPAEARWADFYLKRKVAHYRSLHTWQRRRLRLEPEPPQMIDAAERRERERAPPAAAPCADERRDARHDISL